MAVDFLFRNMKEQNIMHWRIGMKVSYIVHSHSLQLLLNHVGMNFCWASEIQSLIEYSKLFEIFKTTKI